MRTRKEWVAAKKKANLTNPANGKTDVGPNLDAYHKARHTEIELRVKGIDLLNRASMIEARPLRDARAMGLNARSAKTHRYWWFHPQPCWTVRPISGG